MHRALFSICMSLVVMGCATEATGPAFSTQHLPPAPTGYARVYIFRDNVLYLAQAPYVQRAQITMDGRAFGNLANGSYVVVNVQAGRHSITVGSGAYQTTRPFVAGSYGDGYIEVADMTRMEGARWALEGAVGALAARGNAIQAGEDRRSTRQDEINGAADAISQDESWAGPERVWAIGFPSQDDALPRLSQLLRSDQ